jgi:predicted metal-dependent phosphoesterase TrpH
MTVKLDIHIHTCLSPCAEVSQSPLRIVKTAYNEGLNMIFITDHNSVENAGAAMAAASDNPDLVVYPGMEITSKEEVHTLGLFENLEDAVRMQGAVYAKLPDATNWKERRKMVVANEYDEVERFCRKSLFGAADISLSEIINLIHRNNGLAIAAHIDRPGFSVISQLGFIPESIEYDALEVSRNTGLECVKEKYPGCKKFRFVMGSDAHALEHIGSAITCFEGENSFEGLRAFCHSQVSGNLRNGC